MIDTTSTSIQVYLLNFWNPDTSDYLMKKARQGKVFSVDYVKANVSVIERNFLPYFAKLGITDLHELTPENLEKWMQALAADENISGRTANRTRGAVFTALNFAVKKRILKHHPGATVEKNVENLNRQEAFNLDELGRIFTAPWGGVRGKGASVLSFYTGARLEEVRGLRWGHVNLDDGYVDIIENWIDSEGLKSPKWDSRREGVDIPRPVLDVLGEVGRLSPWGTDGERFVFQDIDSPDKPIGKALITDALKQVCVELGIEGKTFHSLRHSFITHFGPYMRPAELRYLVGHLNESTTERYQHRTTEGRKAIREAQENIIPFPKAK